MGDALLPEELGKHATGPQRTKRTGKRFEPYEARHVRGGSALPVSNPGVENPQLPTESESKSKAPSELSDEEHELSDEEQELSDQERDLSDQERDESDPVEDYDVAWRAAVSANSRDYENWGIDPACFIRSYSGLGHEWVGRRPLGAGGFGMAGLWEKHDDDGTVIEQMVIKQIGARKGIWEPEMPVEVKIMRKMQETGCASVVQFIAYKRYLQDRVHRIYMEYCPHGDLKRLYKRYRKFRLYMPEPFLWDVFHQLVETAVAMRYGPADGRWDDYEIVHLDIKPANVFLHTENRQSGVPFYPATKLGDWGLARVTHADDPENPSSLRTAGTPGYKAPEQKQSLPPAWKTNPPSILAHTNIWAIGATMFELMTLHRVRAFVLKPKGNLADEEGINPIRRTGSLHTARSSPPSSKIASSPSHRTGQSSRSYVPRSVPTVMPLSSWRGSAGKRGRHSRRRPTGCTMSVMRSSGRRRGTGDRMSETRTRIGQRLSTQIRKSRLYSIRSSSLDD